MPTEKLGLPLITPTMTSDIPRDMNALAKAMDDKVGAPNGIARLGPDGKLLPEQENVVELPDASITRKGVVQLEDGTSSTSSTRAATANALNKLRLLISNVQNYGIASKLEAEAGTSNVKYMTPLRVFEAIKKLVVKNVPDGYAGLDSNGKLSNTVIPSSIDAYERIAFFDFQSIPAGVVNVSNLGIYRAILVKFLETKTSATSNVGIQIVYNLISGTSTYVGSSTTGSINSQNIFISLAATYPIATGELKINNDNPYYVTEMKSYTETLEGGSANHSVGIVSLRNKRTNRLENIQFSISGSNNVFNGGAIEVLGVLR